MQAKPPKIGGRARPAAKKVGSMLRKKGNRGSTLIALLVVIAALAAGPSAGVASAKSFNFSMDASWAEGA
jgi:hypothetical protein